MGQVLFWSYRHKTYSTTGKKTKQSLLPLKALANPMPSNQHSLYAYTKMQYGSPGFVDWGMFIYVYVHTRYIYLHQDRYTDQESPCNHPLTEVNSWGRILIFFSFSFFFYPPPQPAPSGGSSTAALCTGLLQSQEAICSSWGSKHSPATCTPHRRKWKVKVEDLRKGLLPETTSWNIPAYLMRPMIQQLHFYQYKLLVPTYACITYGKSSDYTKIHEIPPLKSSKV